jgi:hypothetical protein
MRLDRCVITGTHVGSETMVLRLRASPIVRSRKNSEISENDTGLFESRGGGKDPHATEQHRLRQPNERKFHRCFRIVLPHQRVARHPLSNRAAGGWRMVGSDSERRSCETQ